MSATHVVAVALAAMAAVLFGLAAVRQQKAVRESTSAGGGSAGLSLSALGRLLRAPAWLLGALQATVAAGSHVVALALAPITLVQPIGVLAVPVTVIGSAVAARHRPHRRQVIGALLGVGGVAGLTVLLLSAPSRPLVLPPWGVLLAVVLTAVAVAVIVTRGGHAWPVLVRCVVLSVTAAVLFGLNSILLRMVGHLVKAGELTAQVPLLVTAVVGIALALSVGMWAMQSAYAAGSPQVVICCLTLVDPITAVAGGYLLLDDGVMLPGLGWAGALGCIALAALGVVLLSSEHPAAAPHPADLKSVDGGPKQLAGRD